MERLKKNDRVRVKGTGARGVVQEVVYESPWPEQDEVRVVLDSQKMLVMGQETAAPLLYAYALALDNRTTT